MKYIKILIGYTICPLLLAGQIIDRNDFDAKIGSVYQFSGTFSGSPGEAVVTILSGESVAVGALRSDMSLSSENEDGNYSVTSYTLNGALIERRIQNPNGFFVLSYSPHWRLGPRFLEVGRVYESQSSFTYSASGVTVTGSLYAMGGITALEKVATPVGEFDAIKMEFDVRTVETFSGGWSEVIETDTIWVVREVGMVKFRAVAEYSDSFGGFREIVTDYELTYTNRELPSLTPTPSLGWFEGWNFINHPWSYTWEMDHWFFFMADPWVYRASDGHQFRISQGEFNGWHYLSYPWFYSGSTGEWYYMYGPTWIFETRSNSWFLMRY